MGDVKTNIVDFVELQLIENALSARFTEMEKLKDHNELEQAKKEQEEKRSKLDDIENNFHDIEVKRKKIEDTLGTNEEKIKSNEEKLFSGSITDSKELSNYQGEIESLKKNNSHLEDEILELMEEQDNLEPKIESLKKDLEELENTISRMKSEIEEKKEVLKHNMEGLNKRKEDVISRISEEDIKKFNDTKAKKGGIAVSVLKDNFCSVCNMEIPSIDTEKFIDSDTLYNCPVCGRLLVIYRPEIDDIKKELE